jgi:hypothetical protein
MPTRWAAEHRPVARKGLREMNRRVLVIAAFAAMAIASCGGSTDQTSATAKCLRNSIASRTIGSGTDNCADATAGSLSGLNVRCTHKVGNEYTCDVTGSGDQSIDVFKDYEGFYDVTFDGRSIVYQPSQ